MAGEWDKVEFTATTKNKTTGETSTTVYKGNKVTHLSNDQVASTLPSVGKIVQGVNLTELGTVKGSNSNLDNVVKLLPSGVGNSERDLQNLASGNIKLDVVGNLAGKVNKWLGSSDSAKEEAAKTLGSVKTLGGKIPSLAGNGVSGGFNPAGMAIDSSLPSPEASALVSLAKPVFTSGTSVEAATVDIYDGVLPSPQNKLKTVLGKLLDVTNSGIQSSLGKYIQESSKKLGILNKMTSLTSAKSVLDQMKGSVLSGVPITKDSMNKLLLETVGYDGKSLSFKDGLDSLGESMLSDITKNLEASTGVIGMYDSIRTVIKGDFDTADGIFKILENVTSNSKLASFLDISHSMQILNTVTQSLMNLGAPAYFDKIIEKVNHEDRDRFFNDNLEAGLFAGDIGFIESVLKHKSGAWIMASQPNAIVMLAMSFKPDLDEAGEVKPNSYERLWNVFNKLKHDWAIVDTRGGFERYDLHLFAQFNSQTKLAIVAYGNRTHISAMLAAENFGSEFNILTETARRYPNYPILL